VTASVNDFNPVLGQSQCAPSERQKLGFSRVISVIRVRR